MLYRMSEYCRLTKPQDSDVVPGRKYGVYKCPEVGKEHTWVSLNAKDESRECRDHYIQAQWIELRDLVYGVSRLLL